MIHKGSVFRLTNPTVIDRRTAFAQLGRRERVRYRIFGVTHFARVEVGEVKTDVLGKTG